MHQKPTDKCYVCHSDIFCFVGTIIFGRKSNMRIRNGFDSGVTNSNAVCISAQIINGITKTVKRLFDKRNPLLFVERIPEFLKRVRIS